LLAEIEQIVGCLESGDVELEDALALFERGVARLRMAGAFLDGARGRVEELIASETDGVSLAEFPAYGEKSDESQEE
jgi:exodeoxyribonuclease VII small subunit